jgi:branched-chain amino acid transport system substrate-binding protein
VKRSTFLGALAAAATTARAGAQVPLRPGPPARQLTIAVNVPLSGVYAEYGNQVVQGVKAAIDEQNILANLSQLVYGIRPLDDQNSPSVSMGNVSIAAADSTIIGIVGNLTATVTLETLTQYANQSFAVVVPGVTAQAITARGYHNVYRLPTRDDVAGRLFASTIFRKQPSTLALAVTLDADYGPDVARGFVQQVHADRRQVDLVTLPSDAFDPSDAAKSIVARSPDFLFLCGKVSELGPLVSALSANGYNGAYGLSDGFYTQDTLDKYGSLLGHAIVYTAFPPLGRATGIFQQLNDLHREVDGITMLVAFGYAAAQIIVQAAGRTNATTRYQLLTAMQMSGGFNTLVGPYTFDRNGDPLIPNLYFFKVSGTSFDYIEPAVRNGYIV